MRILILFMVVSLSVFLIQCKDNATNPEKGKDNPPQITKVSVPDSIQIPAAGTFNKSLVKAWVSDPEGLGDIRYVYFYSKKPDGSLAHKGEPFLMTDNGKPFNIQYPWEEAGDEKAGDGIYSLTIIIDNSNQTGRYYFTFYAQDMEDSLSAAITDSIEVYE